MDRKREVRRGRKSFGTCQWAMWLFFSFFKHTHTKSAHGFYLKGNQRTFIGHPSQTRSGLQAGNGSRQQLCGPDQGLGVKLQAINPPLGASQQCLNDLLIQKQKTGTDLRESPSRGLTPLGHRSILNSALSVLGYQATKPHHGFPVPFFLQFLVN